MLESVSNFFYDPWTFWGVPVAFALVWDMYRSLGERPRGRSS
jgi:hypothetical protein